MKIRRRLTTKFFGIGLSLLILALLSIGLTMWVTRQLDGGAAAVNEAGRLRMQTWRLTSLVQSAAAADVVAARVAQFSDTLALLRDGDQRRPLFVPWTAQTQQRFDDLQRQWIALQPLWLQPHPQATDLTAQSAAFVDAVDGLVSAIEETLVRLTAVLNLFQIVMMGLAVVAALLMLYISHLFVIEPLQRLRSGFRSVEQGDFTTRTAVDSSDEFGELAAGFNHMAATLQSLYSGLERKVQAKTRDLEAERTRLRALYEISNFLSDAQNSAAVAQGFAQRMRRLSHADAAAVRWSDPATQGYVMLYSDGLPDEVVEQEQCIEAGECACGQAQAAARTRVIPIASANPQRQGACARAGFGAIISVPIKLQQRVMGEIDLFYRQTIALTREDRDLYDALGTHLANAMEQLRVDALLREAAVSQERTLLARELHDSIAQSLSFLRIQMSLLRSKLGSMDDPALQSILSELETGIAESTNDVRELLVHFRTRTNSDDIEEALRTTLQKFEHQSGIHVQLELRGQGVALPSDVQLQLLHVLQEALSNVRKHARADRVQLSVDRGAQWVFTVRDNGLGFAVDAPRADETHVGLHIMRERAQRIGAQLQIDSAPGQGTQVRITWAPADAQRQTETTLPSAAQQRHPTSVR